MYQLEYAKHHMRKKKNKTVFMQQQAFFNFYNRVQPKRMMPHFRNFPRDSSEISQVNFVG